MDWNINDGDYITNGIYYCGKCKTPKQVLIKNKIYNCLCECESNKYKEKEENERRNQFINKYIANIDYGYRNKHFEDVNGLDDEFIFAKRFVEHFDKMTESNTGLYIYGDVGNGKTFIASVIANELLERGYSVLMTTCNNALDKFRKSDEFKSMIFNFDLVILDDFGASRESEFQNEGLFNLIDCRITSKKPIILTTNINRSELANAQSLSTKRIFDRVIMMTHGIQISSSSMRVKKAIERKEEIKKLLEK